MKHLTLFVNDYPNERRIVVGFSHRDYDIVDARWDIDDEQLVRLQTVAAFSGFSKWSQCRTEHFRILIMQTMALMTDLTDAERGDAEHPVIASFNFYVLALVRCMEIATLSTIEVIKINRLEKGSIIFDFSGVMDLKFALPSPREDADSPFTIVVDNTKE